MNYEEKLFQGCESVTIDELKSQPSRLLNHATREPAATACVHEGRQGVPAIPTGASCPTLR